MNRRWLFPALLAITLGGCSLPFGNKSVAQKVEEKAVEQAILQNCKYEQDVCKYYAAMISAYSQPMILTGTNVESNGTKTVSTTKMDGKGNMEIVSVSNGKEESAMILLDKVTYFKDYKDNTWMKMSSGDTEEKSTAFIDPEAMIETFKTEAEDTNNEMTIKKLGEEACGTLTCLKYQMDDSTFGSSTVVWFDTKEYKTRKMETSLNGYSSIVEYSYEPVTIVAPSPVKEAPDFSKMMEDSGVTMPSSDEIQKMMQQVPQGDGE